MKTILKSARMKTRHLILFSGLMLIVLTIGAQSPITSIVTTDYTSPTITQYGIKGAGLRQSNNTLRSNWDSTGSSFTVKYNTSSTADITSITQFQVSGNAATSIRLPVNAVIKLRRKANSYVNDTRNHFNFWTTYSSIPANGSTSGTFNFTAPPVTAPEDAFLSNNIRSGYDNIFQNTIGNLHAGNIERVDFIIPEGLVPVTEEDRETGGVVVFDRGGGDPFKVAAITSVDADNNPLSYGPLISVTASDFGPNLLSSSFNYCIITHDPAFNNQSRPSSPDNQNIRGVYINLEVLGVAINEPFYGYSLFGPDVSSADPDWNNYPTNTSSGSVLDPINVLNVFKDVNSVLTVPMAFRLDKRQGLPEIKFRLFNTVLNDYVVVERSSNGRDFSAIETIPASRTGEYSFIDENPLEGTSFYRLRLTEKDGVTGLSVIRRFERKADIKLKLSPNPVTDVLRVELPSQWHAADIKITVTGSDGKTYKVIQPTGTENKIQLNLQQLPAGVYYLHLNNPATAQTLVRSFVRK